MLSLCGADIRDSGPGAGGRGSDRDHGRLSPIRVTPLDPSITARRRRDPADRRRGHRAPRPPDAEPDRFTDRCPVCGSLAVREPAWQRGTSASSSARAGAGSAPESPSPRSLRRLPAASRPAGGTCQEIAIKRQTEPFPSTPDPQALVDQDPGNISGTRRRICRPARPQGHWRQRQPEQFHAMREIAPAARPLERSHPDGDSK